MKKLLAACALVFALIASLGATEKSEYAKISFTNPARGGTVIDKDKFVTLVIDGAVIAHDAKPIPPEQLVTYVNGLLKGQGTTYIGVYIREGTRYGDVIRGLDFLRLTEATSIGVNTAELPHGREP